MAVPAARLAARHILSHDPAIYYIDHFATAEECRHLIAAATPLLEPALVEGDGAGTPRPAMRTGAACWVAAGGCGVLEALEDRICAQVDCAEETTEYFHVVCYTAGSGEQYRPHLDAFDTSTPRGRVGKISRTRALLPPK